MSKPDTDNLIAVAESNRVVRERPILFSGSLVRAILDDRKTQTRRVVKPQPEYRDVSGAFASWVFKGGLLYPNAASAVLALCPYGKPGDRLWVRETWRIAGMCSDTPSAELSVMYSEHLQFKADRDESYIDRYRPSIFMPRWASRITLEIIGVGIERLQEITEADAAAEGAAVSDSVTMADGSPCFSVNYRRIWTAINGIDNPAAWERNPWVWVVIFRRVKP